MGHIKNNWGGEKNFTIAISANWSGMQLFPWSTSLFRKNISSSASHRVSTRKPRRTCDQGKPRCHKPECGEEKGLRCPKFGIYSHAPWNKDTCTPMSYALSPPPHASFCSSHLLWSKAFPAHLLSPVRWLSNNSCYLVNRWESELKLFRKSLRFGLSTVNSASRKPSWKAHVNKD